MRNVKRLILFSFISCFSSLLLLSQITGKNLTKTKGITFSANSNFDKIYNQGNNPGFYRINNWIPAQVTVTEKPGFTFISVNVNYFDLVNNSPLLYKSNTKAEILGTYNGQFLTLTIKPLWSTNGTYYYISRNNQRPVSDHVAYRTAAFIFQGATESVFRLSPTMR
jgi:hypothetical protein